MKCEDYQQLISLYLDDALSYDEKLQLEVHLKDCPTCQETFEMMHMMIKGLEDLEDVPLPEGFHASVHKALLKEQSRVEREQLQIKEPCVQDIKRTVVKEKKSKKSAYHWLTYASGLAAAVVIGFVLVPSGQDSQIDATQASPVASAPQQSRSRAQTESYALIPEEGVEGVGYAATATERVAYEATSEQWNVVCNDVVALIQFVEDYCISGQVEVETWEQEGVITYVLQGVDKVDFKTQLVAQLDSENDLVVSKGDDEAMLHLMITPKE